MHQFFLRCGGGVDDGGDSPFVEHRHTVGHAHDLGQLGADQHHADALRRQLVKQLVDGELGAHVDATRGLVEEQHARVAEQPLADHDLLLVAARQVAHRLADRGRADRQGVDITLRHGLFFAEADEAQAARHRSHVGQRGVVGHRHVERETMGLAVFGQVGNAVADGVARRVDLDLLVAQTHRAGLQRVGTEDGARHLGSPCPHQAGKTQDLATPQLERHLAEHPFSPEAAHRQQHLAAGHARGRRELVFQRTPDHAFDDLVDRGVGEIVRGDVAPIAQHRHPVDDRGHLVEPVRDVEDAHAAALQLVDHLEQLAGFRLGERRGGLVHDQQLGIERQGLGDLDHLPLRDRQRAHDGVCRDADPEALQACQGVGVQACAVDKPALAGLAGQVDVFGHRQVRHEVQLLVNDRDARRLGLVRRIEVPHFALVGERAFVGRELAADHFHQRRLAGAVFAAHRVHLAAVQFQAHPFERGDREEALGDALQAQQGLDHRMPHGMNAFGLRLGVVASKA